ncbi:DNA primase [Microbacterium phage AloeVera]|uniref:DNA primase n=2 Tax=Akonivirus akoni TaxID=2845587 RepID=A0A6M3SZ16_9CAUD|nr:DNA primase [Microbacterium phage Akoni]QCG78290.1 DNA primase [Microbacterium phage Akoni]QJD51253.1 DNA primase [Microbacterium phage Truong]
MPRLHTKQELASVAQAFAVGFDLVKFRGTLYLPVDFMTNLPDPNLPPEKKVWIPMDQEKVVGMANLISGILFATDSEIRSYMLMLKQFATLGTNQTGVLVRIGTDHVERLMEDGTLSPVTGDFVPNYLNVPFNPKDDERADQMFKVISEWVGGDDNAHSLLYHIATALQPGWSAVRYVLLIGSGRNGKSTLLKMVTALFSENNISGVLRQDMAQRSPVITTLNNKLLNIVMDGPKEFVKDSSTEKTLIAGERLMIEMKYENAPSLVQTNALFMEGLQQEPRVSDKSPALQARLVRFYFPNEYPLNPTYEEEKLRPENLAALLLLLTRHWVNKGEVADKLQMTADSLDLQMQAVWSMSPILRFLEHTASRDSQFLQDILDGKMIVDRFMTAYRPWLDANGYRNVEDDYLMQQMNDNFKLDRKTFRIDKKPTTKRYIKSVNNSTSNAINTLLQGGTLEESSEDQAVLSQD